MSSLWTLAQLSSDFPVALTNMGVLSDCLWCYTIIYVISYSFFFLINHWKYSHRMSFRIENMLV